MRSGSGWRSATSEAVVDARAWATAELTAAGCDTARLDAELLLAEVLGIDRSGLVLALRDPLPEGAEAAYASLVARRAAREPVAYILGRRGFRYIELRCDRRALIPRPETELLVEIGLTLPAGARVLDVGTGSGAVALALASERPDLVVAGSDISAAALSLARENAVALGVSVEFVEVNLRQGLACDALLANLPYVRSGATVEPELAFEPSAALYAGADGLELIRRLCGSLGGVRTVALEHGFDQGATVFELVRAAGFDDVEVLPDLAGRDRVTVGRR